MKTMTKPVILTGLRANNDLTLGNYFGGILPMIDMAKTRSSEFQINMFIPDLHSFTTRIDHDALYEQILHNAKLFAAAGLPLDNPGIHLYRQSYVPAHSELTWILDCFTGFGQLERMTQFKDKAKSIISEYLPDDATADDIEEAFETRADIAIRTKPGERKPSFISAGLFNYPVLMAADILLYQAKYIPVGDDQTQHLEFTRLIANRMNNNFSKFGQLFTIPEPVAKQHVFFGKDQGLRIMDLQNPTKKMSKSDESGKGVIFLSDAPDAAAKKIMSAATDSVGIVHYDKENQPGISNLLEIHALLSGETVQAVAEHHDGQESYGELKKEIAEQVKEFLTDFQAKLKNVDDAAVHAKLELSEQAMNEQANQTLYKVQQAVGLRK